MYAYDWDSNTGGYILRPDPLNFSKEPRPVYYKELDLLGLDKHWKYDKNDAFPYMWAEVNNYYYRGKLVLKTKGGTFFTAPEIEIVENPEPEGYALRYVDIPAMVEKNKAIIEQLAQDTIKKIYNTYIDFRNKVDVFYVAFSGGKDSIVALDLVQRALPHNVFKVLFGDTGMEFSDTYETVRKIEVFCKENQIEFLRAKSKMNPQQTWKLFGPPAVTMRWCCSVHKTTPQILLLRDYLNDTNFTGMAFTGIRGDESVSRSEYDDISYGEKHSGQYSCHPILEWNTAELFLYMYQRNLIFNETYKKGNTRAGCLVCPMSQGKHDYMKYCSYQNDAQVFLDQIVSTSGKKNYTQKDYDRFIEEGYWRTRKSGRELNFGQDKHSFELINGKTVITVYQNNDNWKEWVKTIGPLSEISENLYGVTYEEILYQVKVEDKDDGIVQFTFPNADNSKISIKFVSLFKSVIIKSIYCVYCGVCVAECKNECISMDKGVKISDQCTHCHSCHDIYSHCLRYNSIKNRLGAKAMPGLDRYYSFGIRENWMRVYFDYEGADSFWNTDGDGEVPNKKKDAFLNFVKDSGLVYEDSLLKGKEYKYTKYKPSEFASKMFSLGVDDEKMWAYLLVNLVYADEAEEIRWFVRNINFNETTTLDTVKYKLEDVMENDKSGLGKRNVCDALKNFLVKTPIGTKLGFASACECDEKTSSSGKETITLKWFIRGEWKNPDEKVVLYALYKFAEACGNYKQFTLTRLLDYGIDSAGISPTQIFGLSREAMERILNGLTFNYPDLIEARFTLGLDNITLKSEKTALEVLDEIF